jgi:hypothetical protein
MQKASAITGKRIRERAFAPIRKDDRAFGWNGCFNVQRENK